MQSLSERQSKLHAKPLIITGFATILVLIALLSGFWIKSLNDNKGLLLAMAAESTETRLISQMLNSIHQRAMALQQLTRATTPADKDEAYQAFVTQGTIFSELQQILETTPMEHSERPIWAKIKRNIARFDRLEMKSVSLYQSGQHEQAYDFLIAQASTLQEGIMGKISHLLNKGLLNESGNEAANIIATATSKNETSYLLVIFLLTIAAMLGIFTIIIIRRTGDTEAALVDQSERIKLLYEATSISGLSLDDRITETLKLGCQVLGMEIGKLGCQDPENNTSTFLNTVAPPELPAKRGVVLPLDKTFCTVTFSNDGPIAIHHVSTSSYKDHPAAAFLGMEAYIGTTIYVHDKKFGTVNFSNRKPMPKAFTKTDIDFVNLLGKWISVTMEQIIIEEELQKSKENAEAANHAKTAFLANMSHEIRTPLTAILGYSEMLLDEDQTKEEMEHEINSIITSGTHLQQIINDILDLSKIEAGQLVVEYLDVNVTRFFDELEAILGPQARDKGLSFDIDYQFPLPGNINSDPTRLKQILINLCGNAIKFTQQGGITIDVTYLADDNQLQIAVTDTGIGMSEHEIEHIFKPFSQADESTSRRFGGTGLGLCISKQLAQKLGGDVSVSSEKGNGSQFITRIDVHIDPNNLDMIDAISKQDNQDGITSFKPGKLQGHVLLAEDNAENQRLISKCLMKMGLTVDIAENGQIATDKALAGKYNLVLMDIQMPIMDGLEATRHLRDSGYKQPIISLTANAMQADRSRCFAAGANDYLTKPLDLPRFYKVLTQHINAQSDGQIALGPGQQAAST